MQGLFHLRWGLNHSILVYGPDDQNGCADLFKHPGILAFQSPLQPFEPIQFGDLTVTPLPMIHSKPTLGYLFEYQNQRLAYLTDTVGLPDTVIELLVAKPIDTLVIDCSRPPQPKPPRNHNDLNLVVEIHQQVKPGRTVLTHIGHELDAWLMENGVPEGVVVGKDSFTA